MSVPNLWVYLGDRTLNWVIKMYLWRDIGDLNLLTALKIVDVIYGWPLTRNGFKSFAKGKYKRYANDIYVVLSFPVFLKTAGLIILYI